MKPLPLVLLLSGLLACRKNYPDPAQRIELVYQQPATVAGVQLTLTDVYDSRCPAEAQCI